MSPELKTTHGLVAESVDDGVTRTFNVCLLEDGSFGLSLCTDWGNGEEVKTLMRVHRRGLEVLADALNEALRNIRAYPIGDQE
jgi:hypothetical protein